MKRGMLRLLSQIGSCLGLVIIHKELSKIIDVKLKNAQSRSKFTEHFKEYS